MGRKPLLSLNPPEGDWAWQGPSLQWVNPGTPEELGSGPTSSPECVLGLAWNWSQGRGIRNCHPSCLGKLKHVGTRTQPWRWEKEEELKGERQGSRRLPLLPACPVFSLARQSLPLNSLQKAEASDSSGRTNMYWVHAMARHHLNIILFKPQNGSLRKKSLGQHHRCRNRCLRLHNLPADGLSNSTCASSSSQGRPSCAHTRTHHRALPQALPWAKPCTHTCLKSSLYLYEAWLL